MPDTPHTEAQQQLRARRRARNAQAAGMVLGAVLLGLGAGLGASPLCWISEVRVVAPDPALAQAVARAIDVPAEASSIFFPLSIVERQATSLPQVESVTIDRESFHRLVVTVTRRVPVAMVAHPRGLLLVGKDGVITNLIRPGEKTPPLPVVTGLSVADPRPSGRLEPEATKLVGQLVDAADGAHLTTGLRLDCTQPLDVRLSAGGVEGFLGGTDNLARKVSLFAGVLKELRGKGGDPAYIDVRVTDRPVWMPKAEEVPAATGGAPAPAPPGPDKPKPAAGAGGKPAAAHGTTSDSASPTPPAHAGGGASHRAVPGTKPNMHPTQTHAGDNASD